MFPERLVKIVNVNIKSEVQGDKSNGKKVALSVINRRDSQNYGIKIVMSMKFVAPNRMVWEDESTPSDILGANTQFQGDQILASSSQKVEEMEGIVSMVVEMSPG